MDLIPGKDSSFLILKFNNILSEARPGVGGIQAAF